MLLHIRQLGKCGDNKMPHLIQLEHSIEEVGILSGSSGEECLAHLLKSERVKQSHCVLKTASGCGGVRVIEDTTTTRCISINRFAFTDIIAHTNTCAQDARIVTNHFHFRCYKLFHIFIPFCYSDY